jgi:DNA-binding response OmpR family regulator
MDILVIEDDPTVQQVLTKALERAGYMVKCVDNGLQALADLQETEFRAIVCDVGLPFLEGKSLFDHIKADYPAMAARVLFVTGMADDPQTRKLLAETGRPVLGKPFDVRDLVTKVRAVADHQGK